MTSPAFVLPSLGSLIVRGDDARSFLQNQLSADIALVSADSGQLSGWHDPKGRVLAFLRVLPAADGLLLVMHAGLVATVEKRMRMFVLRARVTIEAGPAVYGSSAETLEKLVAPEMPLPAPDSPAPDDPASTSTLPALISAELSALRMPGEAGWLVVGELPPEHVADDPDAVAAWERAELKAGIPEVYPDTSGEFVAQMLNLDKIGAVSFTKGCYPGQEIVARAHHLGRVKRRAQVFRLPGPPPAPGAALEEPAGKVVRAVPLDGESLVMIVVAEAEG